MHGERGVLTDLRRAERWLKEQSGELRDERFAPIAERSLAVWESLRQQSDVALRGIRLSGSVKSGRVELAVDVNGTEARALGVLTRIRELRWWPDWGDGDRCPLTCDDRVCDDTTLRVERTPIRCEQYASDARGVRGCVSARRTRR
ncbi:hypothetical protein [Pseudonocardia sp. HH130630-07]|uniref:hypothetical protein n=1 Tax=Pseudonocardia sp. HH130630-07 TaxID=1690815 RepID=UPI000814D148|nr:hypothetical protein [Pseudonocardia sp. HH130630-07]ANY08161.1 hypothetical protein AFB00_19840 [Pseudonocardia sp. HH130630-07]